MTRLLAVCLALALSAPVRAGFSLPGHVHIVGDLARARERARQQGKALAFVLTDRKTPCAECRTASLAVFESLRERCEIVYVHPNSFQGVPGIVRRALSSARAGRSIPKTVVVDAGLQRIITVVPHAGTSRRSRILLEANRVIARSLDRQALAHSRREEPGRLPGGSSPPAPAIRLVPEVELHWRGILKPAPLAKLAEFFWNQDLEFDTLRREDGLVRVRGNTEVDVGAFRMDLQVYLNTHYQVDEIHSEDNETIATLSASPQGDSK